MISLMRRGLGLPLIAVALTVASCVFSSRAALGQVIQPTCTCQAQPGGQRCPVHAAQRMPAAGTLGYGPPGVHPGYQGFGLGYHPGYGYGDSALGVGAEGGYPFYGGPGYLHPGPILRRSCGITPFAYYGGPGFPSAEHPYFFGGVGPLATDKPVVTTPSDLPDSDYGCFSGAIPYPESFLAPFTTMAGQGGSTPGAIASGRSAPAANPSIAMSGTPIPDRPIPSLGIETEPVVVAGVRGLKVTRINPGTPMDNAGLHVGDVIRTVNGYTTEKPGNLRWIVDNAAPDNILVMNVRAERDGKDKTITVLFP